MLKRLLSNTEEEDKVLSAIRKSDLQTIRIVGRGALTVNTKEVTKTTKFKEYVELAKQIVQTQKKVNSET